MSNPHQSDEFWADARMIADAVRDEARRQAYLTTGGSDGCAQCVKTNHGPELTFEERVERGHLGCAEALAMTKGAQRTAANMSEVWIAISRVMDDPRFGQWIAARDGAR